MKKLLLLPLLFAVACNANAGFVAGVITGAVIANSNTKDSKTPVVLASDKHDVITCKADDYEGEKCYLWSPGHAEQRRTPAEYAGSLGYKTLYSKGVAFIDGTKYLVMEVSK